MRRALALSVAGLVIVILAKTTFDYAHDIERHHSPVRASAPDVIGLGRDQAIDLLSGRGFSTVAVFVPNRSAHRGTVFRQSSRQATLTGRRVERLVVSSGRTPSCHAGRPRTTIRVATKLHSPELTPRCLTAVAGRELTLIFLDNLVGAPANLSIYPGTSSSYRLVDGKAVVTARDRARALFVGHRSWLPRRITYPADALAPGTYVVQGDSYPSLMHAELVVKPAT
jgi:hypothetical protein